LSGGYVGGGGFVAPKPAKTNYGTSNYGTKNNFGSYGGTSVNSGFGSSSFPNTGRSGSSFGKTAGAGFLGAGAGSLGGKTFGSTSGFGHNSGFGSSSFGNTGKSGSSFGKKVGVGLLGAGGVALGAKALGSKSGFKKNPFGINQYSSFGKPKQSFGSYLFGGKKNYGSRVPGYGTNWGTNFGSGVGRYGTGKKGFSKKALGLGIGAGFLGGAALGVGGTMATYSAMHKYKQFKRMLFGRRRYHHSRGYDRDWDDDNWDYDRPYEDDYYRNYYQRNECYDGCPANSHCEWSFCECNYGYTKKWGRCESDWGRIPQTQIQQFRPTSFDPFKSCTTSSDCLSMDMNLVCNKDLTTQGSVGQCECRRDMKWNTDALECQMYMDADCSKFNYDTPPSATIQAAVEKARREMEENEGLLGEGVILDRTESQNETLSKSLLRFIDEKEASEDDLLEAYCRDVDAHSFELSQPQNQQQNIVLSVPQQPLQAIDPERPPNCHPIPRTACAVAYDEKDCTSGWKLIIPEGQLRFKWMGLYYAYRNDIETVGVRAGCTFTGFSDSSYNGERISISADSQGYDRWVALGDDARYLHMNEDIESVQCVCRS